jgi:hypothetical protein
VVGSFAYLTLMRLPTLAWVSQAPPPMLHAMSMMRSMMRGLLRRRRMMTSRKWHLYCSFFSLFGALMPKGRRSYLSIYLLHVLLVLCNEQVWTKLVVCGDEYVFKIWPVWTYGLYDFIIYLCVVVLCISCDLWSCDAIKLVITFSCHMNHIVLWHPTTTNLYEWALILLILLWSCYDWSLLMDAHI